MRLLGIVNCCMLGKDNINFQTYTFCGILAKVVCFTTANTGQQKIKPNKKQINKQANTKKPKKKTSEHGTAGISEMGLGKNCPMLNVIDVNRR